MTVKGSSKWKNGIPRNSRVRIEIMPSRIPVFDQMVSKQAVLDLPPGLYSITVTKYLGVNANKRQSMMRWGGLRLHDITQKQYEVLSGMRTKNFSGMMTGDGFILSCGASQCDFNTKSQIDAIMHELEHRGVSLEQIVEDSDLYLAENIDEPTPQPPQEDAPPLSFNSASFEPPIEDSFEDDGPAFKPPQGEPVMPTRRPRGRPRKNS
jgi:hypothetical protein